MANNSWKQYGGIYKTDKLHNVGIGTLVADAVLLRQKNLTQFTVQGTINVSQDAIIQGQLNLSGNANVARDLYVSQNSYLTNKLYFGTTTPDTVSAYSYMYGNSPAGLIGVNTTSPTTVFDINATVQNVLTVRTGAAAIRNILAENNTLNGVTSQADTTSATIGFFYGNISSASAIPNSSISATAGNTITITAKTAIINSAAAATMNSLGGNTTIYSSGSTNMTSHVVASNTGTYNNILGELVTIYDTSNSVYLYDSYQNSAANTGYALTLVAKDNNSNTFLNITAPNKGGLSVGGGAYVNDTTRSMGSMGIVSTTGVFNPSQVVVSGNSLIKYKTTTGFNTYAPKTESYILDINGPARIGNGELSTVLRLGFEILSMKVSKRYPSVGFIAGTASAITSPYTVTLAYTINSGQSWTTSNLLSTATGDIYNTTKNYCVYPYNQTYAYVGTKTNYLYYTNNGGSSWLKVNDLVSGTYKRFSTIYVCNTTTAANYRIVLGGYLTNNNDNIIKSQLYYYDTATLDISPGGTNTITYNSVDASLNTINDSDGSGNYMYLVGAGIQKFDLSGTTPVPNYYINSGTTYNSVYCYSTNYVVAVGQNTISYTTDGTNWSNSTVSAINGGSFNLRGVYIYDTSNAVAVGDTGIFAYTINGCATWQTVPTSVLNSSGLASIINGANNSLRGVFMPDLNTFVIADVSTNYVAGSTLGNSKVLYGFYPNLFNRVNNKVLDISGNMSITGDITIDGSGQLSTRNQNFYLLNNTVQNITMGSSASTITIGNNINTTTIFPGVVTMNNDISFNSRLFIKGDISLNSRLLVNGDVSLNSRLVINGDVSLNSRLYVLKDASFVSNINITGNIISQSTIYSNYYDSPTTDIYLGAPATSKNIYIGSQVNGGTTNTSNIYVGNDNDYVYLRGTVYNKTTTNLVIYSKVIQLNEGEIGNGQSAQSGIQIRDNSYDLQGYFTTSVNMTGFNFKSTQSDNIVRLDCSSLILNPTVNSGMVILTPATSSYVGEAIDSSYVITVNNNIDGNYNGSGNFYVATKSILNGDVSLNTRLYVAGDTSLNSRLFLKGDASLNTRLYVGGDTSLNSRLFVNGDTSLNTRLYVGGDTSLNSRLFVRGDASLNTRLYVGGDTSLNSRLFLKGDASLNTRLYVGGDTSLNSRFFVGGISTFSGDVSMNGNLVIPNYGIGIGLTTVTSGYVLDISGNIQHAGVVFQF